MMNRDRGRGRFRRRGTFALTLMSQPSTPVPADSAVRGPQLSVLRRPSFGQTSRSDAWWLTPLMVFLGLSAFIVYSTWAAFQGTHYHYGPYLSPFYSPELWGDSPHSWFGPKPGWWPSWLL